MASSQPNSRRYGANSSADTEPFPPMPDSSSGEPSSSTSPTTTTTTTTTTYTSRGRPYTITTTQPATQAPLTTVTSSSGGPSPGPSTRTTVTTPPQHRTTVTTSPQINRRPIGIRRLPSANLRQDLDEANGGASGNVSRASSGRGRSSSAPQHLQVNTPGPALTRQSTRQSLLPTVEENSTANATTDRDSMNVTGGIPGRRRSVARSVMSRFSDHSREQQDTEYDSDVVDLLDVLDPEVSTLTSLTNVQNSLFVPDLGRWVNRRPTYDLSSRRSTVSRRPPTREEKAPVAMTPIDSADTRPEGAPAGDGTEGEDVPGTGTMQRTWSWQRRPEIERTHSISSVVTDSHYAVLPHGVSLDSWSDEDKEALDDHVRHMLHSKKSKFKFGMIAFGKYVRKPLGFFVTLYATLITLFGLAWVLFLIGWISVGDRKSYITDVVDNVLVALFAVVGDGLAPFRAVDTYHMIYIAHYHHLSWRLRREKQLPKLRDHNDLPAQPEKEVDPESVKPDEAEFSVLNARQQQRLIHHQAKFSKSHSFYKPHETGTHYAFPLRLLVAIVVLLDCHSLLQIALGTCTWAINYHTRPQALTATILSCSITVNITAGILISVGDRRTRKKDVAEKMARQQLTATAIEKVEKHKRERMENLREAGSRENFEVIDEETADQVRLNSK
ncbi:hypothetical protein H2202_000274 [Exophiala xenobiotica]|nr:hypothetical protein H2202_000274 [Exophiala xenobiotica]